MMLSREAIITLRPPHHLNTAAPENFVAPGQQWFAGQWHITHSTSPEEYSQTDKSRVILFPQGNASAKDTGTTLLNSEPDSPTATTTLTDKFTGRTWEILASGKEGQLESWMIEDGSGWIADDSGEVRADWRNSYVVWYISSSHGDGEKTAPAEIQIWERFGPSQPLREETVGRIRDALGRVDDEVFGGLVGRLRPINSE